MFHDTQIVISSVGMDHLISSLDMHITKAHRASFFVHSPSMVSPP